MTPAQAASILKLHNEWRRGSDEVPVPDPKLLGQAIDVIVAHFEDLQEMPPMGFIINNVIKIPISGIIPM